MAFHLAFRPTKQPNTSVGFFDQINKIKSSIAKKLATKRGHYDPRLSLQFQTATIILHLNIAISKCDNS